MTREEPKLFSPGASAIIASQRGRVAAHKHANKRDAEFIHRAEIDTDLPQLRPEDRAFKTLSGESKMKTRDQSHRLYTGAFALSAMVLMTASAAQAAAPIGHHKPVHHHHVVQSTTPGSLQAEPATPPAAGGFDYHYHPNCFQTSNQVMDGNGGLKWVPKMECRY